MKAEAAFFLVGGTNKKESPNLFPTLRKGHGPTSIIFFCTFLCTFYQLCLCHIPNTHTYLISNTSTDVPKKISSTTLLFFSSLISSIYIYPSCYCYFYSYLSEHSKTKDRETKRERKKVREIRHLFLFSSKS